MASNLRLTAAAPSFALSTSSTAPPLHPNVLGDPWRDVQTKSLLSIAGLLDHPSLCRRFAWTSVVVVGPDHELPFPACCWSVIACATVCSKQLQQAWRKKQEGPSCMEKGRLSGHPSPRAVSSLAPNYADIARSSMSPLPQANASHIALSGHCPARGKVSAVLPTACLLL